LGERTARKRPCERRLDGRTDVVRGDGRVEGALGGGVRIAGVVYDEKGAPKVIGANSLGVARAP
jgi:hypothetical protein